MTGTRVGRIANRANREAPNLSESRESRGAVYITKALSLNQNGCGLSGKAFLNVLFEFRLKVLILFIYEF